MGPRDNYVAWDVDCGQFEESWSIADKLRFFARFALLAPSAHNTQPWHFRFSGDELVITSSPTRALNYSGPLAGEPHVSLGACAQTFSLAAEAFGTALELRTEMASRAPLVRLSIAATTADHDPALCHAIQQRCSNRSFYAQESLSPEMVKTLTEPRFPLAATHVVSRRDDIEFLAEATARATRISMGARAFRGELSQWVRNNLTRQYDGMPGFVQGIPTVPSLVAPHLIRNVDISKKQAALDGDRVRHTPLLVLILANDDSYGAMFDAGRVYADLCIRAQPRLRRLSSTMSPRHPQ